MLVASPGRLSPRRARKDNQVAVCRFRMPLSWRSRAELCATGQVSRSCCLTPLFPFLAGRRTKHGLSTGHRVTPKQQERHSQAQIPHSQPVVGSPFLLSRAWEQHEQAPSLPPQLPAEPGSSPPSPCRPASSGAQHSIPRAGAAKPAPNTCCSPRMSGSRSRAR